MLRQKTKISQRLPDDLEEEITSFQSFVIRARRSKNYSLVNIGNMDKKNKNCLFIALTLSLNSRSFVYFI